MQNLQREWVVRTKGRFMALLRAWMVWIRDRTAASRLWLGMEGKEGEILVGGGGLLLLK